MLPDLQIVFERADLYRLPVAPLIPGLAEENVLLDRAGEDPRLLGGVADLTFDEDLSRVGGNLTQKSVEKGTLDLRT